MKFGRSMTGLITGVRILSALVVVLSLALAPAPPVNAEPLAQISSMLDGVNRARVEAGLAPLVEDHILAEVAYERSADMVRREYFSHTTPDGHTVFDLLDERGINFMLAGENLAWNTGGDQAGPIAVNGFLNSQKHRDNILQPEFSQIGIGVASDGSKVYFTLVFVG